MRRAGPLAALALLAALLAVQPAVEGLAPHVEDLSEDLAQGRFDPLGAPGDGDSAFQPPADLLRATPGSLTGQGGASFAPGPDSFPKRWSMDRVGAAGQVTIRMQCDPALGAMKRIKAYDQVEPDYDLSVQRSDLDPVRHGEGGPSRTATFTCTFPVQLEAGEAVPIVSPHPRATVSDVESSPHVRGIELLQDSADTYYVRAPESADVELTVTYHADPTYYDGSIPRDLTLEDVPPGRRPDVPPGFQSRIRPVLQEMDLANETHLRRLLRGMQAHFQAFDGGPIPGPDVYPDKYHAIALGGNGCCRHRAFAFAVTARTLGIPTRVVANEAHAYAESWVPGQGWLQLNLGGCGTYRTSNPDGNPAYRPESTDPKTSEPDEEPANRAPTRTRITDAPAVAEKGEPFVVAGKVADADGDGLGGVPVRVFLNATKAGPGHLAASATTARDGTFRVRASVPDDAPPRAYHLLAGARAATVDGTAYAPSWSDPRIRVTDATRLRPDVPPTVGVDAPFRAHVRLVDTAGAPVPGANVTLLVDGQDRATNATADDGWTSFRTTLASYGNHTLAFRFPGDANRGPSNATRTVTAARVGVDAPSTLVVPRGGTATLRGRTLVAGEPGPADVVAATARDPLVIQGQAPPNLTLPNGLAVPLDPGPDGAWTLPVHASAGADLMTVDVLYRRTGDEGTRLGHTEVTIKAPTRVHVDAPTPLPRGEPATVTLRLTAEGEALPGETLTVTATHDGARIHRALQTDPSGAATLRIPASWTDDGEVQVAASFAGTDRETRTQAQRTIPVQDRPLADLPLGWAGAALVLGLAAAGGGLAAWRSDRSLAGAWARLLGRRRPHLAVRLQEAGADLPPVWGLGEPATVEVAATLPDEGGRDWTDVPLEVTLAGETREVRLGADGTAAVAELARDAPDEVRVTVRYAADDDRGLRPARTQAAVRFVQWGPEMTRVYEELRTWARDRGVDVPDPATPRETGAALHAAGAPREAVADLVRRFEAVNYGGDDPTRADWARLVRARDRIQDAIEEAHRGG